LPLVFHTSKVNDDWKLSSLIDGNRLANCMSMVALTIAATMFSQYWSLDFGIAPATFVLLVLIILMNACGVRLSTEGNSAGWQPADWEKLYGNLEWASKGAKIFLIVLVCITMIAIKAGGESLSVRRNRIQGLTKTAGPNQIKSGGEYFAQVVIAGD